MHVSTEEMKTNHHFEVVVGQSIVVGQLGVHAHAHVKRKLQLQMSGAARVGMDQDVGYSLEQVHHHAVGD